MSDTHGEGECEGEDTQQPEPEAKDWSSEKKTRITHIFYLSPA